MLQQRNHEQPQHPLGQQGQTLQHRNGPSRRQAGPSGSDVNCVGGRPLGRQLLGPDTALHSPTQSDMLEEDWLGGGMSPRLETAGGSRRQQEGREGGGRQVQQRSQWETDDSREGSDRRQPQEGLVPWEDEPDSQGVAGVDPFVVRSRSNGSGGRDPPGRQDVMDAGDGMHQGEGGEEGEGEDDDDGGIPSFDLLGLPSSAVHTTKQQDIGLGGSRPDGSRDALPVPAPSPQQQRRQGGAGGLRVCVEQHKHNQGVTAASAAAAGEALSQGHCMAGSGLPPTVPRTHTIGQQQKRTAAQELPPEHHQKRRGALQEERQPVAPVAIASGLEQHGSLLGSGGSRDRHGGKALEIFAGLSQADDTRHSRRGGDEGQHHLLGSANARPPAAAAVGALTPRSLNQIGSGRDIVAVRAKPAGLVLPPGPATAAVHAVYRPGEGLQGPPRSMAKGGIGGGPVTSLRQLLREQEEDIDLDLGDL